MVCLEQGDWSGPADYMSASPEAELAWVDRWSPDPNVRRGPADYPLTGDADVRPVMFNGVGGGLVQWAAMWQPLLASDLRVRSLDGVADDWPIGWSDLAGPYAQVARRHVGVGPGRRSGSARDGAVPESSGADRQRSGWPPRTAWTGSAGTGGPAPTPSHRGVTARCRPVSGAAPA